MSTAYSPFRIQLLFECHLGRLKVDPDHEGQAEVLKEFLSLGVIENYGESYTTTKRGVAWVQALCNTPVPQPAFIDEMGRVL